MTSRFLTNLKQHHTAFLLLVGLSLLLVLTSLFSSLAIWHSQQTLKSERYNSVQVHVSSAIALLNSLNKDVSNQRLSLAAAQNQAKSYLRNMSYLKNGEFWVLAPNGNIIVHPKLRSLEGKDALMTRDAKGKYHIEAFINEAKNGGGFSVYYWPREGENTPKQHIAYNKLFSEWDWVVGSGIYVEDINPGLMNALGTGIIISLSLLVALIAIVVWIGIDALKNYRKSAIREPSSGLFTHVYFEEVGPAMVSRCKKTKTALTAISINIDKLDLFKKRYGFAMGTTIIQRVSTTIRHSLKPNELAFLLNNEQLLVLLMGPEAQSFQITERIRQQISKQQYIANQTKFSITISAGIASCNDTDTIETLLERANRCLNSAIEKGNNCSIVASNLIEGL